MPSSQDIWEGATPWCHTSIVSYWSWQAATLWQTAVRAVRGVGSVSSAWTGAAPWPRHPLDPTGPGGLFTAWGLSPDGQALAVVVTMPHLLGAQMPSLP